MNHYDGLFELIKSLSQIEQKNFTSTFGKIKNKASEKIYIQLFNQFRKQEVFDEQKIKEWYAQEKFNQRYALSKAYLKKSVLKSLRVNTTNSIKKLLENNLDEAQIFYQRSFYKESKRLIIKIKKTSKKYEYFHLLLNILKLEKLVLDTQHFSIKEKEAVIINFAEEIKTLAILKEINAVNQVNFQLFNLMERSTNPINKEGLIKIKQLIPEDYFKKERLLSQEATMLRNATISTLHYLEGNYKLAQKIILENIQSQESLLYLIIEKPTYYINEISNLHILYLNMNKEVEANELIHKISFILKKAPLIIEFLLVFYRLRINQYIHFNHFKKMKAVLVDFENETKLNHTSSNVRNFISLKYVLANAYFLNENYSATIKQLNTLLDYKKIIIDQEIILSAEVLNILAQYELGRFSLLEYQIKVVAKLLSKQNQLFETEQLVLQFIKRAIHKKSSKKRIEEFLLKLRKKLLVQIKKASKQKTETIDFIVWVDSKLEKKSLITILERN